MGQWCDFFDEVKYILFFFEREIVTELFFFCVFFLKNTKTIFSSFIKVTFSEKSSQAWRKRLHTENWNQKRVQTNFKNRTHHLCQCFLLLLDRFFQLGNQSEKSRLFATFFPAIPPPSEKSRKFDQAKKEKAGRVAGWEQQQPIKVWQSLAALSKRYK